jgi:hypothetical protein
MKKALAYAVIAILLGTLTIVGPLLVLKPNYYEWLTSNGVKDMSAVLEAVDDGEGTYGERGALGRAASPSTLSSVGLMLIPSFLFALGISLYIKKRVIL